MENSCTEIKVRGYHLDVYQHVNNARYLELLEEARWRHFDNFPPAYFTDRGWGFVVVNININYKFPAVLGDVLQIETGVVKIGNSSIVLKQDVHINGTDKQAVSAEVTFVMLDLKTRKVLPITGELKEVFIGTHKPS